MGVRLSPYLTNLRVMLHTALSDYFSTAGSLQATAVFSLLTLPWLLSLLASAFGPYQPSNVLGACKREDYGVERKDMIRNVYEEWCFHKILFFLLRKMGEVQGIALRWFASFMERITQSALPKSSD